MIVVVNVRSALQEQLHDVSVSATGRHSQDARAQPVPAIHFSSILQEDVGNCQMTEPGRRNESRDNEQMETKNWNNSMFILLMFEQWFKYQKTQSNIQNEQPFDFLQ